MDICFIRPLGHINHNLKFSIVQIINFFLIKYRVYYIGHPQSDSNVYTEFILIILELLYHTVREGVIIYKWHAISTRLPSLDLLVFIKTVVRSYMTYTYIQARCQVFF